VGTTCHPQPDAYPAGLEAESDPPPRALAFLPWPAHQGSPPGLYKPHRPPWDPHSCPSRPEPCAPPPGTLARRRRGPPPSSPHRRRGAVQELRKEVRSIPASLVVVTVHHTARSSPPEFRRRTEPRRHDVRCHRCFPGFSATLDSFAGLHAAHRC
jgi:hypothetical protein